jgi:FtsZ-binding cell division protein ZapB
LVCKREKETLQREVQSLKEKIDEFKTRNSSLTDKTLEIAMPTGKWKLEEERLEIEAQGLKKEIDELKCENSSLTDSILDIVVPSNPRKIEKDPEDCGKDFSALNHSLFSWSRRFAVREVAP